MPRQSPSTETTYQLTGAQRRVFAGILLGMFVASVSQTIVGPAMPRIVAELGGMDHYSWVATAAMLVSAVTVPIVGKLSDLYGRRSFYLAGISVYLIGSIVCGFAGSFWMLVAGRGIQGFGMGTLLPLSQTILGDMVPPRQRGKYQGFMGGVFGFTSVAGPIVGGIITDNLGWRWLFFITLPIGAVAMFFIARFLHLPFTHRKAKVDLKGIVTMSFSLIILLLALSLGGTTYAWNSPLIVGAFVVGMIGIAVFVAIERNAVEPILPLRLFKESIFTWAVLGAFAVSMVMFGLIFYIPIYAQAVLGVNATNSGLILTPLMLCFIIMGIVTGLLITRTGIYKPFMLVGVVIMGVGTWLLTGLDHRSSATHLTLVMVVAGFGLGMCLQQYALVVQNISPQADLGVATAANQFFRNVGSTVGVAIFGTAMTTGLSSAVMTHIPADVAAGLPPGGGFDAGSVLDPAQLANLPPVIAEAVRQGTADRLHIVFLLMVPIMAFALLATAMIRVVPLRTTLESDDPVVDPMMDPAIDPGGATQAVGSTAVTNNDSTDDPCEDDDAVSAGGRSKLGGHQPTGKVHRES